MNRARLLLCPSFRLWPTSFVRSISITLGLTLIVAPLVLSPLQTASGRRLNAGANSQGQKSRGQERRVAPLPPRPGPPVAHLPNLDEVRRAGEMNRNNPERVAAPRPIPSTMRSRKKSAPPGMQIPGARLSHNSKPALLNGNSVRTAHLTLPKSENTRSHHARSSVTRKSAGVSLPAMMPQQNQRMNFALTANGGVATASSSYYVSPWLFTPAGANNGIRSGVGWGQGEGWNDNPPGNTFPDWLQIDFNGTRTIDEINVFTGQDNWQYPSEPTESMTFSLYGLTAFDVQYWNGSSWPTVPNGNIAGNNKVWRKITFSSITTTKVRVLTYASVDGYSRITELEAWGPAAPSINVALAANGGVASASSSYYSAPWLFTPAGANNGIRSGAGWGQGEGWNDNPPGNTFPDWLQIDFNGIKTIDEIDVFTGQDNWQYPSEPTQSMTFSLYGLTAFDVQYWNGSAWATIPNGSVTGNNKVWRRFVFAPITTTKIRVLTSASIDGYSRITEVEAWDTPATPTGSSPSDLALARLDPLNRTGSGGEDLLSNNFNWSLPLVGLPGRGLDLGLTLAYNSLVWTKSGNYLAFDLDNGSIAPGFRLGFPVIEGPYYHSQTNANYYLLISPAGARVELRQNGSGSIVYESKDSSYLQLTDNLDGTMTLRSTDGSRLNYIVVAGNLRCNRITDRNGNFITATYKSWGELETATDTLGRVLTFNYDANSNLQSITQMWGSQTHEWATFGWGTAAIGNNFPGLTNLGPNSTSIPVLTQVGLPDGSRYNFEYNNGYGMVSKIRHHASDNRLRRQTTYVAPASATDCPRLSERRDWAANWNGDSDENPTTNEEAVTYFSHDVDSGCRMTLPDGAVYKEYYGSSWQSGLATETRSYATVADANSNVWQKKTTTTWTQDNPNAGYLTNPRTVQADVEDGSGNHRRTTIDYGAVNLGYVQWGLAHIIREYGVSGATATEFRRTQTDYNLTQPYLSSRIVGLVSSSHLYDSIAGQWLAKTTYEYDTTAIDAQATAATQHDTAYSQSFTVRGNATRVSRWDVTDIDNGNKKLTSTVTYNAAGSVLSSTDPGTHTTTIQYADSFADGINRNTFAYPTTLTDAGGFSSTVKYNFEFGGRTRVEGPPPQNQPNGLIQTFTYDSAARIERVTTVNTGAYTRYVYGSYYVQSFWTVNAVADDAYSCQILDGHGRAYAASGNHPNSTGGYRGQLMSYDIMGRIRQQTNWTEINHAWAPIGDDATGWQWNNPTEYNWQGRPLKTYNMDGTYQTAAYSGCGCAGGEVVTLTDEVGRQQKVYSDVLGRPRKTEILNDNGTVYSATTNDLNARDQIKQVRQWAGAENGGAYQDTTMSYDGYGRLQSKHVPEQQDSNGNPAYTTWTYKPDDTLETVTDARGASATYGYNSRHLVTAINYSAPAGITPAANVTFTYDAAENRTSMNDGSGSATYSFDSLSRLQSETKTFNGLSTPFPLSYGYNLANELTSVTDPANATINYSFDAAGRLNSVTGSAFGGVTQYAVNAQYRAWGAVKGLSYGNNRSLTVQYNARLQTTRFDVPNVMTKEYQYYDDGRLRYSQDFRNDRFDRSYAYDHAARISQALSGIEARGGQSINGTDRPYNETFAYDPLSHVTSRTTHYWDQLSSLSQQYVNNRNTGAGWTYDADGRVLVSPDVLYNYDAVSNVVSFGDNSTVSTEQKFDGDGRRIRSEQSELNEQTWTWESKKTTYYLRSSVLGGAVVTELNSDGTKRRTFVHAGDGILATQVKGTGVGIDSVEWEHRDPSNVSYRATIATGEVIGETAGGSDETYPQEFDPVGADAGLAPPLTWNPPLEEPVGSLLPYPRMSDPSNPGIGYSMDGIPMPADDFFRMAHEVMHGRFGLLQAAAKASAPRFAGYSVSAYHGRLNRYFGSDRDAAEREAVEQRHHTVDRNWLVSNSWSDASFLPGPPQEGHLGPRPKRGAPYVDRQVLNRCTEEYFGVTLDSFEETRPGQNGTFTGIGPSYLPGNPNGEGGTAPITVTNSVKYSRKWLTGYANEINRFLGEPEHQVPVLGLTDPRAPATNYTGHDSPSPMQMLMTQIHELGHSLDKITRMGYDDRSRHPNRRDLGGQILEDCVRNGGGFRWRS